jgi:hypothetical protein
MENPFYDKNYFPQRKEGNGKLQGILLTLSLFCFLIALVLYNMNSSYGVKTIDCSRIDKVFIKNLSPGICPSSFTCASAALYRYTTYHTDYSTGQPVCVVNAGAERLVKCYSMDTCNGGFICKKEFCVDE